MNVNLIIRIIAIVLLIISLFMLFPLLFALYYGEKSVFTSFIIPISMIITISTAVLVLLPPPKRNSLSPRGAFFLVTILWVTVSFFSCLPFLLSKSIPRLPDAFFETMSGYTTTGASVLRNIEALPKSILFWRSLTHWLGGMGIVVLTVAVLPLLGVAGFQLLKAEAPGPTVEKITPKIAETAKRLWIIYLGLSVMEVALLSIGGLSFFDSLTHTFGTLATGGFSPKNKSVGSYNSAYIDAVVTSFMILAGMNFGLYSNLLSGKIKVLIRNTEVKTYIAIFLTASLIIAFRNSGYVYHSLGVSMRYGFFQAASILTTTGFTTTNYEKWPAFSKSVLFILMFIGGCSGSTGGGIKVIRIVTLFKQGWKELKYQIYPHAVFQIRLNGRILSSDIVHTIFGFAFLYIFLILLTTCIVSTSGVDLKTSLSTALVTLGNIGPGFGRIGPAGNYAFYPDYIKWYLSFIMMVGRLELYTVLVLFTPTFWRI